MQSKTFINRRFDFLLVLSALIFSFLCFYNLSGWLMDDDEGTDFYEVWQLQLGNQPGVDYIAEQQPLFLQLGKATVNEFGRSPLALRSTATIQLLIGSLLLALAVRKVWGSKIAFFTLILLLSSPTVYEQARLFRPDPMMMGWEMAGLAAAILAVKQKQRVWWLLSGMLFGISILWKLFGIFPVVGLLFFFIYRLWIHRNQKKDIYSTLVDGLFFSIPFLLFSVGISLLLYGKMGFYYGEAFQNHLQSGDGVSWLELLGRPFIFLLFLIIWFNPVYSFLVPLSFLNRKRSNIRQLPENKLLLFQLLTPIIFFFITRPIHFRYFLHIFPPLAILFALQIDLTIQFFKANLKKPNFLKTASYLYPLLVVALIFQPGFSKLLTQRENDSIELATLVASKTDPDDIVISDYAGINFLANRNSIYEASIIAGAQIDAQIITGELLIDRIEETDTKMVLLHVADGLPLPHQLVNLVDYDQFRTYLGEHFNLLTVFHRAGQQIEVYERK